MRLTEDRVKQAILHDDKDVREGAVYYFSRSFTTDPSIMRLAIQAIERFGWKDAFEFYSFMSELPFESRKTSRDFLRSKQERSSDLLNENSNGINRCI